MKFFECIDSPIGTIQVEADQESVFSVSIPQAIPIHQQPNAITNLCTQQIIDYFLGLRKEFDLPLKPEGTPFQLAVWTALSKIPYGETRTYVDIANTLGKTRVQRAVGFANYRNLLPIIVPCHRVVSKKDGIGGYALGLERKIWLLDHERTIKDNP
jgi:methylated-DNA-[protein]-cysteine S-methyltransferase